MPRLFLKQTGAFIGTVSDADLLVLVDQLEEEDQADDDYFVDGPTVDLLEENGASATLVSLLRSAVGNGEGVDIRWEK
jgi:hypothetical protein